MSHQHVPDSVSETSMNSCSAACLIAHHLSFNLEKAGFPFMKYVPLSCFVTILKSELRFSNGECFTQVVLQRDIQVHLFCCCFFFPGQHLMAKNALGKEEKSLLSHQRTQMPLQCVSAILTAITAAQQPSSGGLDLRAMSSITCSISCGFVLSATQSP